MKTAVIILNYCDAENCIQVALSASNTNLIDNVVIVDNCSPDGSIQYLREHENGIITVVESKKNGGYAYGYNTGINYALSHFAPDIIFVINSDIIFEKDLINACIEHIEKNPECGVVSSVMLNRDREYDGGYWSFPTYSHLLLRCSWLYRKFYRKEMKREVKNSVLNVDVIRGSFLCFSSSVLKLVGGFDTNTFLYYEENIICKKIKKAGYKVNILTNYTYIHNHKKQENILWDMSKDFKSAFYYAKTYLECNKIQLFFLKYAMKFGVREQESVNQLKLIGRRLIHNKKRTNS